jgi:hypothetical protein
MGDPSIEIGSQITVNYLDMGTSLIEGSERNIEEGARTIDRLS